MDGENVEIRFEKVLPVLDQNAVKLQDNARFHSCKMIKYRMSRGAMGANKSSEGVMYEDNIIKYNKYKK